MSGIDLVYRNRVARAEWDRFAVHFADGGTMRMNDPRRLGGVELDPNEERLGADAATITARQLDRTIVQQSGTTEGAPDGSSARRRRRESDCRRGVVARRTRPCHFEDLESGSRAPRLTPVRTGCSVDASSR